VNDEENPKKTLERSEPSSTPSINPTTYPISDKQGASLAEHEQIAGYDCSSAPSASVARLCAEFEAFVARS
jgi:hypothetical protein